MGGKLSSRPRVNTPLSFTFCRESSVAPDGVKVVGTIDLSSPNHSLLIGGQSAVLLELYQNPLHLVAQRLVALFESDDVVFILQGFV